MKNNIFSLFGYATLGVGLLASSNAALAAGFDLANYQHIHTYALPAVAAAEASAVTWNWNTDILCVGGDEGDALVEVNKQGVELSKMTLTGFADTEGITYIGNGKFVITEERLQDAYLLTYAANGSASRASLSSLSLGNTVGNIGIEGISYDRLTGNYVAVKEASPQAVYDVALNFASNSVNVSSLFAPALGVADLSDVQTLSNYSALVGTTDQDNLLIFSQETSRLLEVSRTGQVLSEMDFSSIASDIEGVTIDSNGTIYLVGETPSLYVLTSNVIPVPEPESYALILAGLGLLGAVARRRNQ